MTRHRKGRGSRPARLMAVAVSAAVVVLTSACGTTAKPRSTHTDGLNKAWSQGITDSEVRVGFQFSGLGVGKADSLPDPKVNTYVPQIQTIVDYINANGGAGGRKIVPVWHREQADAASKDVEDQAMCTDFTVDRPVFIVADPGGTAAIDCYAAKGLPQVVGSDSYGTSVYASDPYLTGVPVLNYTRLMQALGEQLIANNFFKPNAKIGFVVYDRPDLVEAGDQGLKPALAKAGLTLADEFKVSTLTSPADAAKILAQLDGAALKFKGEGIDHVVFLGPTAGFMLSAEKQKYRPRYAVTTNDWPSLLPSYGVTAAQLSNVYGVGYSPDKDVADYKTAGDSPARTTCLNLLAAKDIKAQSGADEAVLLDYCDQLFLIKAALDAAAKPVTGDSFMRAVGGLGSSFKPASTWGANYSADHRDGAASVRYLQYAAGCACFQYVGPDVKIN